MSKNFDLGNEINLHYQNTIIQSKTKESNVWTPTLINYAETYSQKRCKILYRILGKEGWLNERVCTYTVEDLEEHGGKCNSNLQFRFKYPFKKNLNINGTVLFPKKVTKRQWLWGLSKNNTKIFDLFLDEPYYLNYSDTNLIREMFKESSYSLAKSLTNLQTRKFIKASAISDCIILRKLDTKWRNKFDLAIYYKKHRIGFFDSDNWRSVVSKKLYPIANKLHVLPPDIKFI